MFGEQDRQSALKILEAFTPMDDVFARCVFRDSPELVQLVLRIITGNEELEILNAETQKDLKRLLGARSIELDIYGEDKTHVVYDLELQKDVEHADPKRARYHGSVLDVEKLEANKDFSKLPEVYVIFLLSEDYYGKGADLYRFERTDQSQSTVMKDNLHIIYVNGSYRGDDALGHLMHDMNCSNPSEMRYYPLLANRVRYWKERKEGR